MVSIAQSQLVPFRVRLQAMRALGETKQVCSLQSSRSIIWRVVSNHLVRVKSASSIFSKQVSSLATTLTWKKRSRDFSKSKIWLKEQDLQPKRIVCLPSLLKVALQTKIKTTSWQWLTSTNIIALEHLLRKMQITKVLLTDSRHTINSALNSKLTAIYASSTYSSVLSCLSSANMFKRTRMARKLRRSRRLSWSRRTNSVRWVLRIWWHATTIRQPMELRKSKAP